MGRALVGKLGSPTMSGGMGSSIHLVANYKTFGGRSVVEDCVQAARLVGKKGGSRTDALQDLQEEATRRARGWEGGETEDAEPEEERPPEKGGPQRLSQKWMAYRANSHLLGIMITGRRSTKRRKGARGGDIVSRRDLLA